MFKQYPYFHIQGLFDYQALVLWSNSVMMTPEWGEGGASINTLGHMLFTVSAQVSISQDSLGYLDDL